jgi:replicative DNA helicase
MGNLSFTTEGKTPNLVQDFCESVQVKMEKQILGCLKDLNTETHNLFNSIEADDFTIILHDKIFKAYKKLEFKDVSVNKLNKAVRGLDEYFLEGLPEANNIEQLVRQFIEDSVKRRIVDLKHKMNYANQESTNEQIIIQGNRVFTDTSFMVSAINETKERIEHIEKHGYGLQTHISALNLYTRGFGQGQLIVIGGATSMGKTALATNIASHIADTHHCLYFSLEMTRAEMVQRVARAECGADDRELVKSVDMLIDKKLTIIDKGCYSIDEIENMSYIMSYKAGLDCIIVDQLQLMRLHKSIKLESYEDITARLKILAKELQIPVILVSQLNRATRDKDGVAKLPELSMLRGSGSIEQDADIVLLLFRGSYYKPKAPKEKDNNQIIIAKNRNGRTGSVTVAFSGEHFLFSDKTKIINSKKMNSNDKVGLRESILNRNRSEGVEK